MDASMPPAALTAALIAALATAAPASGRPATAPAVPAASVRPATAPAGREFDTYALTISGGVSLGTYEAGLNWALVRYFKVAAALAEQNQLARRPRLAAVTGASAGGINALLAAALWCESDEAADDASVDRNLLRDAWLGVGLDDLLPDDPDRYGPGDGLFASRALEEVAEKIRQRVFAPEAAHRFIPGCSLPVGITVTRFAPEEREVMGLRATTQKFSLPWLFEVTPSGRTRMHRLPLGPERDSSASTLRLADTDDDEAPGFALPVDMSLQALLASAAFPLAFGARDLCDCTATCPDAQVVESGSCPGPNPAHPLSALSCKNTAPGLAELKLCRRAYVDGGVFDNAPIGLAIDLAESTLTPSVLHPITYLFIDPDVRRLRPASAHDGATTGFSRGLGGAAQLFGNLVATARNRELSRTIEARGWARTTQGLLREAAFHLLQYALLHQGLRNLEGDGPEGLAEALQRIPGDVRPLSPRDRLHLGRVLHTCLRRTARVEHFDGQIVHLVHQCGDTAVLLPSADPLDSDPAEKARALEQLSPSEVVELAAGLAELTNLENPERRRVAGLLADARAPVEERLRVQGIFRDRVNLGASAMLFLADELDGLSRSDLPEVELRAFKTAVLKAARVFDALSSSTHRLANAVLEDRLRRIEEVAERGPAAAAAAHALSSLRGMDTELFAPDWVRPVRAALDAELAKAPQDAPASRRDELRRLLGKLDGLADARGRLQRLSTTSSSISQSAGDLLVASAGERSLLLSSRFPPLAGAQLSDFAGFLDRPLRELDYYSGVYDAVHELAVDACDKASPYAKGMARAVRKRDSVRELQMSDLDTQRCIGGEAGRIAGLLDLGKSDRARGVFFKLARAELAASLGSQAAAEALLSEPSWAWLDVYQLELINDPPAQALSALLSRPQACQAAAKEALCAGDLTFDQFLDSLARSGYRPHDTGMKLALGERDRWWSRALQKIIDRSLTIELSEGARTPLGDGALLALGAGELITRRDLSRQTGPRLELDPSTIPREPLRGRSSLAIGLAHLLPYRLALDVAHGGAALAWIEPSLRIVPAFSISTIVEPIDYARERHLLSATFGLVPAVHFGSALSLGAGARVSMHWNGESPDLGLLAQVSVFQDRFGVGVGVRHFGGSAANEGFFIQLSVSDLNGLAYWFTPWSRRETAK
jgi:predicted acylesterase/phospholipase RssA